MADSGFDSGPPSKKSKTSSPTSSITSFDHETADLSRLLSEFNDELPAELGDPIPPRMMDGGRKLEDTLQNNRHLSALLGMDLQMPRGAMGVEIPRMASSNPSGLSGTELNRPGGTVNWSVRPPLNMHPYGIPLPNQTSTDSVPDLPLPAEFGMNNFASGSGPLQFAPGLVRNQTYQNNRNMYNGTEHMMRLAKMRMLRPLGTGFGATANSTNILAVGGGGGGGGGASAAAGNVLGLGARGGLLGGDKLANEQMTNGTHLLLSSELQKTFGAGMTVAMSQGYATGDARNGAVSETSSVVAGTDTVRPMLSRASGRILGNPLLGKTVAMSPVTTSTTTSSDTVPVNNSTEKQRLIQQQLVLIFHAHKCQRREQANGIHQPPCPLPQCQPMKNVLRHMVNCTDGRSCRVPHCASSRQIIAHWRNCPRPDCPICAPLKNGTLRRILPSSATPVPAVPTDANPVYEGFSPKHATAVHPPAISTDASGSQISLGSIASSAVSISAAYGGLISIQSSLGEDDIAPVPGQDWRLSVTQDLRNHLVHKLVQAIFPTHEPTALRDPRMSNLVRYAKKVEGDMYEKARSREDYYHLLAEKIYKIQKELEQKKLRRIIDQNGIKVATSRAAISDPSLGPPLGRPFTFPMSSPSSPPLVFTGDKNARLMPLHQGPHPSSSTSALLDVNVSSPSLSRLNDVSGLQQNGNPFNMVSDGGPNQARTGINMPPSYHTQDTQPGSVQHEDVAQNAYASRQMDSMQQLTNVLSKRRQEIEMMEKFQLQNDLMSTAPQATTSVRQSLPSGIWGTSSSSFTYSQAWDRTDVLGSNARNDTAYLGCDQFFSPGSATLVPGSESLNQLTGNHIADDPFGFEPMSMPSLSSSVKVDIKHEDITDDEMAMKSVSVENHNVADAPDMSSKMDTLDMNVEIKTEMKNDDYNFSKVRDTHVKSEASAKSESAVKSEADIKSELQLKSETPEDNEAKPDGEAAESSGMSELKKESSDASLSGDVVDKVACRNGRKVWTSEELEQAFMPLINKLSSIEPEAVPFRTPVDPVALCIPDYFQIVKKPMDLSLILSKLESGAYSDPWNFIDDIMLMFDNAWLYNRKTSKVYKYCTKLAEVFESEVDPVMQSLGFCCGRRFVFTPQILCCFGKQLCVIPRDSTYYNYLDRYIYCEKCFNELPGDEIEILDDPSNPGLKIKKEKFVKEKNDKLDLEPLVDCLDCGRRMHKICVQHLEQIWTTGFICDPCRKVTGQKKKENKYTSRRLPPTKLGSYLENRINSLLKRKAAGAGDVTVRVLSSYDKSVEVKPAMKARFVDSGQMSESFPYRVKAIFAFEEIDGVDVCFFGMHVQEYGSDCPASNARRVYIAYLDSVNFFQPRQYRTTVYHELLIGYMDYVKTLGFQMAHIWACPPSEGDDYIFYCHPPDMKIPKPKRLQEWYRKMLDKAMCDHVIFDYKDILKDAIDNEINSVTELPYFEGDFWPNILEENIKELNQEEMEKRQREEEEAAADTDDGEPIDGNVAELQTVAGKKKDQKSGKSKKKNPKTKKLSSRRTKSSLTQGCGDLSTKILASMEKHKEVFFVIRLQPKPPEMELPDIKDPDPLMSNELMDGRDPLLTMARDKHLEFSSLRRAKYSSMALLHELHIQAKDNFIYTCNHCKASVETRYHCLVCEDFDLCVACYRKIQHPHRMTKLGLDLDDGGQGDSKPQNPQEARRQKIQTYVQVLEHSCICRDANCTLSSCRNMRKALAIHPKECRRRNRNGCATCKQLFTLCCYHAKGCREKRCLVPFCQNIKQNLEKQRQKERLQQQMMMRRRVALMHRAEDIGQVGPASLEPIRTMPPLPPYGGGGLVGNGKTGKSPPMLSNEAMFHSGEMQGGMHQFASQSHSEFLPSAQPCNQVVDGGWGQPRDPGQFAPQDAFGHIPGFHRKTEPVIEGMKPATAGGPTSIERLTGSEDKQKLVAFLKANPRLMADVIKKVRQQDAVNQQMKHQQMHMMPASAAQSMPMMDGPMRNPMAPMTNFPMQQPGIAIGPGRQIMTPQMKMMPNGDHGNMLQQSQILEYQQHQQQQQQQQQQMQQQQMIPQGYDGYPPGPSMAPSQPHMGFSMPGPTMTQDYMTNRMASRMQFSQSPRHIHPSLMNHQMHRQPHPSLMGYQMPQEMMGGTQGLQQMADPSSVMCSPLSTSSPRPVNNCSPSPHHLPPHYMNKVLTHSADAGSGGGTGGVGPGVPRTGSVGLQPNASGPAQLCPDGSSVRQLSFSPNGKNSEMPSASLSRPTELLGDPMQFSVANSFSHFLDRK